MGGEESPRRKKINWNEDSNADALSSSEVNPRSASPAVFSAEPYFLEKVLGICFSPLGVVVLFVIINYPWLKEYIGMSSAFTTTTTTNFETNATAISNPPRTTPSNETEPEAARTRRSSSFQVSPFPPECENPLKMMFDKNCREELKKQRRETKMEKLLRRKEKEKLRQVNGNEPLDESTNTISDLDIPSASDLECSNILSRQCRQKKRLLAQMTPFTEIN